MSSTETIKQEIVDWANSDEVKETFKHAGWSASETFPDACRYLYEYIDTDETDGDSGIHIPSGHCLRVQESNEGNSLVVVFSVDGAGVEKQFFRFAGRSNGYEINWERAELQKVLAKPITTIKYIDITA